ncbi:MAG: FeoC-like transcriptional regulator [Saccharofermentanales bacterium]|jgi:predicted transcriptional regulator
MLREMLAAIQRDQMLSKGKLAAELNVSEAVIDQAITQLIRMDYLVREQSGTVCPASCMSCPMASACGKELLVTYRVTEKGLRLLEGMEAEA